MAKVSANVPAGRFDVKIYGIARGNTVNIEAKANAKIKLDSSGVLNKLRHFKASSRRYGSHCRFREAEGEGGEFSANSNANTTNTYAYTNS